MRNVQDRSLPPDHNAFVAAEPPTGRVIVIAPTRAACETIEIALGLHIETFLEQHHGEDVRALARDRKPFGIVAGTGTGKTLAIRPIAEEAGRTLSQLAVAWTVQQPGITCALCGAKRPEQIRETAAAMEWRLTEEQLEQIRRAIAVRGNVESRAAVSS